jgi:hypothetical protein
MANKMIYDHHVQFIPKGVNPHETSTIRTVNFQKNIQDKHRIEKASYYEADKQNIIDKYALRKHWDIFNMEIHYYDAPWGGWNELCTKLSSFKEVKSMKHVDSRIYLFVRDNYSELNLCDKIKNYYHGFSPVMHSPQIVKVESKPEYI